MRRPNQRREEGFTAIEIVIVLAIIGILVAIAVTTFISMIGRYRLSTECRVLNQTLQDARLKAIASGIPHGVAFIRRPFPQHDTYFIFMDCANAAGAGGGDLIYTDNNTNPADNTPITDLAQCNTVTYDPRVRNSPPIELAAGNSLGEVVGWNGAAADGAKLEYVMFNQTGQMVRGNDLAIGPGNVTEISIRRKFDDGYWNSGVDISPGTGLSYSFPMRRE